MQSPERAAEEFIRVLHIERVHLETEILQTGPQTAWA